MMQENIQQKTKELQLMPLTLEPEDLEESLENQTEEQKKELEEWKKTMQNMMDQIQEKDEESYKHELTMLQTKAQNIWNELHKASKQYPDLHKIINDIDENNRNISIVDLENDELLKRHEKTKNNTCCVANKIQEQIDQHNNKIMQYSQHALTKREDIQAQLMEHLEKRITKKGMQKIKHRIGINDTEESKSL